MRENIRKASLFVGLTFLVNWSMALLFFTLGGRWQSPVGAAFGAVYMFVPTGVTGLPGFVVLAAVILILWLHDCDPQRNARVEETTVVPP